MFVGTLAPVHRFNKIHKLAPQTLPNLVNPRIGPRRRMTRKMQRVADRTVPWVVMRSTAIIQIRAGKEPRGRGRGREYIAACSMD